jgi:hypothetical protein
MFGSKANVLNKICIKTNIVHYFFALSGKFIAWSGQKRVLWQGC